MTLSKSDARQNQPRVSVLVACYNQARYVAECLESVRSQTYPNVELITIDDCSRDESASVIRGWLAANYPTATFVVHERNQGVCKTFNDALHRSSGKYVSLLAADDVFLPDKLERQVEILENSPADIGVVYSDSWQMDAEGMQLPEKFIATHRDFERMPEGKIFSILLGGNFIPAPTTLIRRECFEKVGSFDEELIYEDFDMWLRIARHYQFAFSPHVSARYRVVPESVTRAMLRQSDAGWKSEFKIYEKWIRSRDLTANELRVAKSRLASIVFHMYAAGCAGRSRYLRSALRHNPCKYTLAMWLCATGRVPFRYFERLVPKRAALHGRPESDWSSSVALR